MATTTTNTTSDSTETTTTRRDAMRARAADARSALLWAVEAVFATVEVGVRWTVRHAGRWLAGRGQGVRSLVARAGRRVALAASLLVMVLAGTLGQLAAARLGMIPTVSAQGLSKSPDRPNRFDPRSQTGSTIHSWFGKGQSAGARPGTPQPIAHDVVFSMQPGSVALPPGQAAHFLSNDGRLEVSVPVGAATAADVAAAGGQLKLAISQIAPGAGSNAGGSGLASFGTFLIQLVDGSGRLAPTAKLHAPITVALHYGSRESALDLTRTFVVYNGSLPEGTKLAPLPVGSAPPTQTNSHFGAFGYENAAFDRKAGTLTVHPLLSDPSGSMTWNTDAPVATFGKPDPFNVDLSTGSLSASFPIDVPAGPGGLTPPVSLTYGSAGVSEQHNPLGATGWVGEGWNLSLGAISWAEHNVTSSCSSTCGNTWEDSWQLSDPFGTAAELIPPNINVATYYDDSPNSITPSPVQWHTAPETHAKIYSYVGPVNPPDGLNVHTPCFRVFLPNGIMEEFGCTTDSLEYYYSPGFGDFVSSWNLDLITDPQGNQIHITYHQDVEQKSYNGSNHPYIRDAVPNTIEWDTPSCHNAQAACSTWAPLMQVSFGYTNNPARLTDTPANCNTGTHLRCDDPKDLSGSGGLAAPDVQSIYTLNDILVQVRTSGTGSWNTLKDYQVSYSQNGPNQVTDPSTGKAESSAGQLLLTQLQEVSGDGSTSLPARSFGYGRVQQFYEDDIYHPNPSTFCTPPDKSMSWNQGHNGSGCLLWSTSYDGNSFYLNAASNGLGLTQNFGWDNGRNNTHGVNGGGSNTALPGYCNTLSSSAQATYPCDEADDQSWSHAILTQQQGSVIRAASSGNVTVTTTTVYAYKLAYPLAAQECGDCVAGMYWGNQNDGDYLDYYNGKVMGFAETDVNNPDGSVVDHKYLTTEGWGVYDTSQVSCFSSMAPIGPCHNSPWWDLPNAAHGHEYETDSFDTNGTTLLAKSLTQYQALCPPSGVAGTPPWTGTPNYGNWNGNLVSELDHNNPVGACDIQTAHSESDTVNGASGTVPQATTYYTYDSYGRTTSAATRANDGYGLAHYEAETLLPPAATNTTVTAQSNCCNLLWSGGAQAWMQATAIGQYMTLNITVPLTGTYDLTTVITKSYDYGIFSLKIDGTQVAGTVDGHNPTVIIAPPIDYGNVTLNAGSHTITWTTTGKNGASSGYKVGIDEFDLRLVGYTPAVTVANNSYVWNDAVTANGTSATGTYLIDFNAFSSTENSQGNRLACTYTSYDTHAYATGQTSTLTLGEATTVDRYTNCGTAPGYTPSGDLQTTHTYDTYGDDVGMKDPDANAGVAGHTGCTIGSTQYSSCTTFDTTYYTLAVATANALNQSEQTGYGTASPTASNGFGLWPISTTDKNGQTTTYGYDALDRMTTRTLPGETNAPTSQWVYANWCTNSSSPQAPCLEIDQTQRLNSSNTITSRAFYDGWGNLVETRDPAPGGNDIVQYREYDAAGHDIADSISYFVTAYTGSAGAAAFSTPDANQATTQTTYDGLDRPLVVTDALSHQTTTSYDVHCTPTSADTTCYDRTLVYDALGHAHTTLKDARGQQIYDKRFTGVNPNVQVLVTTLYAYNAKGEPNQLLLLNSTPNGQVLYTYDAAGRKLTMTDPDRGSESYVYDQNGNRTQATDARGSSGTVYAGYDGLDRQLWRNTTNSPTGAYATYSYDSTASGNYGVGHLTGETFTGGPNNTLSGSYAFVYDARGQQTSQTITVNGGTPYTIGSTYDDAANVVTQTYPDGEVVTTGLTAQGWLAGLSTQAGSTNTTLLSNAAYTGVGGANHLLTGAAFGGGTYIYAATYDNLLRMTDEKLTRASDSTLMFEEQRSFDASSNLLTLSTTLPAGTDNQAFCYDEQNRVTWASSASGTIPCGGTNTAGTLTGGSYTQSYAYDTYGRLTSSLLGSYTYGDAAHLHAVTAIGFGGQGYRATYDAAGNMTCRTPSLIGISCASSGAQLTYDNEGRLVTWQNQPTSPTSTTANLYDGEGNRVEQQATVSGTTTTTLYLGNVEEIATTNGAPTLTTYYYAGTMRIATAVNGNFSYLGSDALGSATIALNSSGTATGSVLYAPYGGGRYMSGVMPGTFGFTGQRADAVTGLDYYVSRYYDPVAQQFTSADTILAGGGYDVWGLSRYAYVEGNPLIRTDPQGHFPPFDQIASAVTTVVQAVAPVVTAVVSTVATIVDQATGISSIINDVQTIFSGNGSFFDKLLAGGDLLLNVAMDVSSVVGIGEGLKAAYLGAKVAAHAAEDAGVHALEHAGEDAVEHVAEHAAEDAGSHAAEDAASKAGEDAAGAADKCSFSSSTPVLTPHGEVPIGALRNGDKVTAYDPATDKPTVQTVEHVWINHDSNLLDVTLRTVESPSAQVQSLGKPQHQNAARPGLRASSSSDASALRTHDEIIHTTTNHPWLSADKGWLVAGNLVLGEQVVREDGTPAVVVALKTVQGSGVMYNLTVSNVHTFAVGTGEYVVHNSKWCKFGRDDSPIDFKQTLDKHGLGSRSPEKSVFNLGDDEAKKVIRQAWENRVADGAERLRPNGDRIQYWLGEANQRYGARRWIIGGVYNITQDLVEGAYPRFDLMFG